MITDDELENIVQQTISEIAGDETEEITVEQATQAIWSLAEKLNLDPMRLTIAFSQAWERNHA